MNILETFKKINDYSINQLKKDKPTCFNGNVEIEKYKITIEKIEESKEVYQKRLQKIWEECDNQHNWQPIRNKAESLGITLFGSPGNKKTK